MRRKYGISSRTMAVTMSRHGKGDHDVWYSPITKRHVTVDGKIKSRFTANAILKQAVIRDRF